MQDLNWRTSRSCDGGACVEAANWRKPSRSMADGNCVETASTSSAVLVRDTTDRGGAVLAFGAAEWAAFTVTVKRDA